MNQLFLGASIPFAFLLLVYIARRFRAGMTMLILAPALTFTGMLWAVLPDIPRFLGMHELYSRLSHDPRCDIFLWHYTIDCLETDSPWFAAGLVLIAACFLYAAWRELAIAEAKP